MRTLFAASFLLAVAAVAVPADGRPAAGRSAGVEIGEVSSQVERAGVDYAAWVRSASEDELRTLDLTHVPRGKRVIVSVALVRLDTFEETRAHATTCVINATLRDAKGGAVFAILEGKAKATGGGERLNAERSALQGALHGALARIPEVLRD